MAVLTVDFSQLIGFTVLQGNTFNTDLFETYYIEVQINNGLTLKNAPVLHILNSSKEETYNLELKPNTTDIYYYELENMMNGVNRVYVEGLAESETPTQTTIDVDFSQLSGFDVLQGNTFDTTLFSNYNVEVQVKDGYSIKNIPVLHIVSSTGTENYQLELKPSTTNIYHYELENTTNNITSVYVDGLAEVETPTQTTIDVDFSQLSGFSVLQGNTFDTTLYSNYKIEVQVNDGFKIINIPTLKIIRNDDSIILNEQLVLKSGTTNIYYYELENTFNNIKSVEVLGLAKSEITSLYNDYPLITCYKVNSEIMQAISNIRFQDVSQNKIDLGSQILSLVRYPVIISTKDNANIKLGYFQTEINAALIENQINEYSLGKVFINGSEQNTSDIDKVTIELLLPLYGFFTIDSKYINTEIEVKYKIDIITNNCVIEIYSNNILIHLIDSEIGYNLPYILRETSQNINSYSMLNSNILKQNVPVIYVKQKPKENNTYYTTDIIVNNLADINGFIKCTDYEINNIPTDIETELIKKCMINGVII